ncbi:hypothetical protein BD414DRAFT_266212 [Trametes punicea]|nr:hypothetical protein BD414DRAFT_266212 [Trametes punicea]
MLSGSCTTWLLGLGYHELTEIKDGVTNDPEGETSGRPDNKRQDVETDPREKAKTGNPKEPRRDAKEENPPKRDGPGGTTDDAPGPSTGPGPRTTAQSAVIYSWQPDDRRDWEHGMIRPPHRTLLNTGFRIEQIEATAGEPAPNIISEPGVPIAFARYVDGASSAALTLQPYSEQVNLHRCYRWTVFSSKFMKAVLRYRFAAAWAVSYNVDRSPMDGIIGLGISDTQDMFDSQSLGDPATVGPSTTSFRYPCLMPTFRVLPGR